MVQVGGVAYDLEGACREVDRLSGQVKLLQAASAAYTAAERSADGVYHIALQDMSTQLQVAASDRAAGQTALLKLQECAPARRSTRPTLLPPMCTRAGFSRRACSRGMRAFGSRRVSVVKHF